MKPPSILFKFPTRSRPERFFRSLDSIYDNLHDLDNFQVKVTADADDDTMTDRGVWDRIKSYPNADVLYGVSHSKIDAVNRDMPLFRDWEILVVMSDDMLITMYGFDSILRQQFDDGDLDKLIHVPDWDAKNMLATMYIAGKTFYERFGYIYHPSYKSLWCDNEVMDVAQLLQKYKYVDCLGMIHHMNPAYGHLERDEMFNQQQLHWNEDEQNYYKRKALNFEL